MNEHQRASIEAGKRACFLCGKGTNDVIPKQKNKLWKQTVSAVCACTFVLGCFAAPALSESGQSLREKFSDHLTEVQGVKTVDEAYYYVRQSFEEKGYRPVKDARVSINVTAPTLVERAAVLSSAAALLTDAERAEKAEEDTLAETHELHYISTGLTEDGSPVLAWEDDIDAFTWDVQVEEAGLYEIQVTYMPLDGRGTSIQRGVYIDGVSPYEEAYNVELNRTWRDIGEQRFNNVGDELRPKQEEIRQWRTLSLVDGEGYYEDPLLFYFSAGAHTLRMEYVDEPIAIRDMTLVPPTTYPTYEAVSAEYAKNGYKDGTDTIHLLAQETLHKSDQILRREYDSDPLCEPSNREAQLLNTIGGSNWKYGNQEITWSFDVETAGLYQISMRVGQWWNDGLPSHRNILIDGEIPFREMQAYRFAYVKDWQYVTLGEDVNEDGLPFLFYFTPGTHTISMRAVLGPITTVAQEVSALTLKLSELYRKIIMITGQSPDTNYEYELDKTVPGLLEGFQDISDRLVVLSELLTSISSKKPSMANNFDTIIAQLNTMIKKPDSIPARLDDLYNAQTSLGDYITTLKTQYLQLDYFDINPQGAKKPRYKAGIAKKATYTWFNFLRSFTKDYDSVGNVYTDGAEGETISLWISRGREWSELIKQLADEDFTTQTGIRVNMNILPSGQLSAGAVNSLMLAITSGRAPDVASGVDVNSPVEFAIRNAAAPLNGFDGYEEVVSRYRSTIMTPYIYKEKTYALPDQMDFQVLIYRKDILNELGIRIPDTWEDVYEKVLPVLTQNGMQFMPTTYPMFLYQNGGVYYNDEGTLSALDSPEAYVAFKEWTDQYVSYGMPVEANFFNRFRSGEMPIGIVGYADYIKITTAAPELFGRWDIAPVPGHRQADGTIDRSVGGIAGASTMMLADTDKKESCWQFMKWWSSTEVQEQFGRELEALLGVEARWNPANIEAFNNSSWDKDHKQVILNQLTWAKEQPVVLGGYYTARHVTNAWTRVVTSGQIARDSLEEAVKEINKELRAKQREYGEDVADEE